MSKVLDDKEVIRLVRRHCTDPEKTTFQRAMRDAPHLVAATVQYCLAFTNLTEEGVVRELRRAICLLKQGGRT